MQPHISKVEMRDFNSIKDISDKVFGLNYITLNQLNKLLSHESLFYKISVNDILAGFCLAVTDTQMQFMSENKTQTHQNKKSIVIKSIAIHPDYQRQKMATTLINFVLNKIKEISNISDVYYPSWVEHKSVKFAQSLTLKQFKKIKTETNFWMEASLLDNFTCVLCGQPPCMCDMHLYRLKIGL